MLNRDGKMRLVLAVMGLFCLALAGCQRASMSEGSSATQVVEIVGQTYTLELALDDASRYQGLSDRREIPSRSGMLFVFPQPRELQFVMRRCLVPIDLIYLGPGGRIVSMHKMAVEPYDTPEYDLKRYSSGWPAQFVIELPQGSLDELGVKVGEKIELPLTDLKARAK